MEPGKLEEIRIPGGAFLVRHATAILAVGVILLLLGVAVEPVLLGAILFAAGLPFMIVGSALEFRVRPLVPVVLAGLVAVYGVIQILVRTL